MSARIKQLVDRDVSATPSETSISTSLEALPERFEAWILANVKDDWKRVFAFEAK